MSEQNLPEIIRKQFEVQDVLWSQIAAENEQLYKAIGVLAQDLQASDFTVVAPEIAEELYHTGPGISQSMLKDFNRSPFYFYFKNLLARKKETKAMTMGSLAHTFILEPYQVDERYLSDQSILESLPISARPRSTKAYKEWEKSQTKKVVPYEIFDRAKAVMEKVWAHPVAKNMLKNGLSEQTIYAIDPETGLLCRCRVDYFLPDGVLIDVKTTRDASPWAYSKSVYDYGYHVQSAYYNDVATRATGQDFDQFLQIVIENEEPCDVAIYSMDFGAMELGQATYRKNLNALAKCIDKNQFPGYPTGIQPISVPAYAFAKDGN